MTDTITILCHDCENTGTDLTFGGKCSSCNGATEPTRSPVVATPDENAVGALADWLGEQKWSDFAQSLSRFYVANGYLSPKQITAGESMRAKIAARDAAKGPEAPRKAPLEGPGMYALGERIFKVQKSRESGNLYAKELVDGSFQYAAGAVKLLGPEDALSLDAAKAYGRATGTCCCCGRELTDPASIEDGIGPICATKF